VRTRNGNAWIYDPAAVVSEVARLLDSKVPETAFIAPVVAH
jgi:hypothetical protein